jgi:allantoinase
MYDLIVRGGTVAGHGAADVGVLDGAIAAVAPALEGGAREELDARGLHVLPGGVDPHVHFNEPGRTHWEGIASGSAALAAGGFTAFFDMPLNSTPPTTDASAFDAKLAAARESAVVDYGLWGAIVPGNRDRMPELAERGAVGFKAFMSHPGTEDFARADDRTLHAGMAEAARLGRIVAVHAENDGLTSVSRGRGARDWLDSRPLIAELEAIGRAIAFAADTGCALHIVHVSHARGVDLVSEARGRGVDVTCETCPHYLVLTPEDVEALGPVAKCAPPVRHAPGLWERLGDVQMVTSDHSPCPPELKAGAFGDAWGGIAGAQTTRTLLARLDPETLARLTATGAAERFGLPRKGRIAPGADADLALLAPGEHTLRAADLRYRHPLSPYVGRALHARVVRTLLRGREAYPEPRAQPRLLTPEATC